MAVIIKLVESIPEGRRDIHNWAKAIRTEDVEGVRTQLLGVVNDWWSKQNTTTNEDFLCDQATRALGWMDVTRARAGKVSEI